MDDKSVFINAIPIDSELIGWFLLELTKRFNGSQVDSILSKLADGTIDLKLLLENNLGNTEELEKLRRELKQAENELQYAKKDLAAAKKRKLEAEKERRKALDEASEYLSAMRYYEDKLSALRIREEILKREDLGMIFSEPTNEDGWEIET